MCLMKNDLSSTAVACRRSLLLLLLLVHNLGALSPSTGGEEHSNLGPLPAAAAGEETCVQPHRGSISVTVISVACSN